MHNYIKRYKILFSILAGCILLLVIFAVRSNFFGKDVLGIPSTFINPKHITAIAYQDTLEHFEPKVTRDPDFIKRFIRSLEGLDESDKNYQGGFSGPSRAIVLHREKSLFYEAQDISLVFIHNENILQFGKSFYEITPTLRALIDEMTRISVNEWY